MSQNYRAQQQPQQHATAPLVPYKAADGETVSIIPKSMIWLVTFNTFLLPAWVNPFRHVGMRDRLARLFQDNNVLRLADILCLQETFSRQDEILGHAAALGFKHVVLAKKPTMCQRANMRLLGSGLMIISKHDIVESSEEELPVGVWTDYFAMKSVMHARVSTEAGEVHVFNAHTQAQIHSRREDASTQVRIQQLEAISAFVRMKVAEHPNLPVIICGDMNVDNISRPDEFSKMLQLFMEAIPDHRLKEVLECREIPTWGGTQRLDYIFVGTHKYSEECDVTQAQTECFGDFSDHRGVSAAVNFAESEYSPDLCPVENQRGALALTSCSFIK